VIKLKICKIFMNYYQYKEFVVNYKPFEWEINSKETRDNFKNKHSFVIHFIRFLKVKNFINEIIKIEKITKPKIFDVGAYPGNMVLLSKKIFSEISKYVLIGLDLNEEFKKKMKNLNVDCINTEIDPSFPDKHEMIDWKLNDFDICYLLDTIEHLVDPIYCLGQINKSLKKNGYLIITTDNITNFLYITDMLRKGKSPNVHPALSSMVYRGNHRPHHKEFSKFELEFILQRCGFEIINHQYFDRMQGEFFIDTKKNVLKKHKIKKTFKNVLHEIIKKTGFLIKHLRNHQIILARKNKNIEEILDLRKTTTSKEEWLEIRKQTIGY
tara:strand:- start:131 stop:1105 length:975 start_codon:yes stop_codon:yes gene_type:complete